jgi:mRNA interferase MazF
MGEIWYGDLSPIIGHEQAGQRPLLVVSIDRFNSSAAGLVVVLPITSTLRNVPWHVPIAPPEGGLTLPSAILCEAVRSISRDRLLRRLGTVSPTTLETVQARLRVLLDL